MGRPKSLDMSQVFLREMIRRDTPEVLAIEKRVFENPWTYDDFLKCFGERGNLAIVAEFSDLIENPVLGYMIIHLKEPKANILKFAIHPDYQGMGVGQYMVTKLPTYLTNVKLSRLLAVVNEYDLPSQLFFKECGLRAVSTLRGYYGEPDSYSMQYRYRDSRPVLKA